MKRFQNFKKTPQVENSTSPALNKDEEAAAAAVPSFSFLGEANPQKIENWVFQTLILIIVVSTPSLLLHLPHRLTSFPQAQSPSPLPHLPSEMWFFQTIHHPRGCTILRHMAIATGVPTRPKNALSDLARLISSLLINLPSCCCCLLAPIKSSILTRITHEFLRWSSSSVPCATWAWINEVGISRERLKTLHSADCWVPTDFVEMVSEVLANTEETLNCTIWRMNDMANWSGSSKSLSKGD